MLFELPKEVVQFIEFGDQRVRIDVELLEKFGNGIERSSVFFVMSCRSLRTFRSGHDGPPLRPPIAPKIGVHEIKSKSLKRDCPHASDGSQVCVTNDHLPAPLSQSGAAAIPKSVMRNASKTRALTSGDRTNSGQPDNANSTTTSPPRNAYGKSTSLTVWSNRST